MGSHQHNGVYVIQGLSNVLLRFEIRVIRNGHTEVPNCMIQEDVLDVELPASQIGICFFIKGTLYDNFAKGWYVDINQQW